MLQFGVTDRRGVSVYSLVSLTGGRVSVYSLVSLTGGG